MNTFETLCSYPAHQQTSIVDHASVLLARFERAMNESLGLTGELLLVEGRDWGEIPPAASAVYHANEAKFAWLFKLFENVYLEAEFRGTISTETEVTDCLLAALKYAAPGAWDEVQRKQTTIEAGQLDFRMLGYPAS